MDGSKESETILKHAERMAIRFEAEVVFLYVQEPPIMLGRDEVIDEAAYHNKRMKEKEEIETYLLSLQDEFQKKQVRTRYHIVTGPTLDSILKTAGETEGVLIALATHGLDQTHWSLQGSIAAGLLKKADVPLLLLPGS